MERFSKILSEWEEGNHVEDEDLIRLARAYQSVADSAIIFGEKYALVASDANQNVQKCRNFLMYRGIRYL